MPIPIPSPFTISLTGEETIAMLPATQPVIFHLLLARHKVRIGTWTTPEHYVRNDYNIDRQLLKGFIYAR